LASWQQTRRNRRVLSVRSLLMWLESPLELQPLWEEKPWLMSVWQPLMLHVRLEAPQQ
jgi:hypothetical protein